jgi:hypothetical protein
MIEKSTPAAGDKTSQAGEPANESTRLNVDVALTSRMTSDTTVSWSLDQNVIVTTEDKLWRRITEHLAGIEARKGWIAPASILATLIAALCTTTFKVVFWLTAADWKAIFVLASFAAAIWSVVAIVRATRSRSAEDLLDAIKKTGGTHAATLSLDGRSLPSKQQE